MRWIRFYALFATWSYAVWQQPPEGFANLPLLIGVPGMLVVLVLEEEDEVWLRD